MTRGSGSSALLRLRAAIGSDSVTSLALLDPVVIGGRVALLSIPGRFAIEGICLINGAWRIDADGSPGLKSITPVPLRDQATIAFETVETGRTTLTIVDHTGNLAATLVDEELREGTYLFPFDASALPSGSYRCILVTPTGMYVRALIIQR